MNNTNIDKNFKYAWQPYVIVFITNTCIMILELIAGRLIAPHMGVSLYTWTSIIGVVLAGITIGNYLGGAVADRWASKKLLGYLILASGLLCVTIFLGSYLGTAIGETTLHIIVKILLLTSAMFLLPCIILGMVSPLVAKLAVNDLATTGSTVGRIYAAGAFGSIVGTFLTGFFLISWIGTYAISLSVAALLFILAIAIIFSGKPAYLILPVIIAVAGTFIIIQQDAVRGMCDIESNYFCIRVIESEQNGDPIRTMILDKLVHSFSNLNDPEDFKYEYAQIYAEATDYLAEINPDLVAAFIGGGGYTFPRYMENRYPNSTLDVIEIDPVVTEVALTEFGVREDTEINSYNLDARIYLKDSAAPNQYDIIFGDAFNGLSVPYHLTTLEYNQLVKNALKPSGIYIINIVDYPNGPFILSFIHTLRETFEHVYLADVFQGRQESTRTTFVVIASERAFSAELFAAYDAGDGETLLANSFVTEEQLNQALAENESILITDSFAPVEQMIISLYQE